MLRWRWLVGIGSVVLALGAPDGAAAQPGGRQLGGNIKYSAGQNIQPVFEGWTKSPDGRFVMYFGYLNRNHVEELFVPIGPDNSIEPGGPDRAQPTYFYPRFNRRAFTVTVPGDWGKKELVWTVTVRGRTEKAIAWLQPEWEIDPALRGSEQNIKNEPPAIAVEGGQQRVVLPTPLKLTATVTDDGLPKPARPSTTGPPPSPPAFERQPNASVDPVNLPGVEREPRARGGRGLSVMWFVWRGPAGVAFAPNASSAVGEDGKVVVTATFTTPGEYVLRAVASDTRASVARDLQVTVSKP
jgi:hypothetical protein